MTNHKLVKQCHYVKKDGNRCLVQFAEDDDRQFCGKHSETSLEMHENNALRRAAELRHDIDELEIRHDRIKREVKVLCEEKMGLEMSIESIRPKIEVSRLLKSAKAFLETVPPQHEAAVAAINLAKEIRLSVKEGFFGSASAHVKINPAYVE